MQFHFFFTTSPHALGFGDNVVLYQCKEGLEELGHRVTISDSIEDCTIADHIFLCNTYSDLNPKAQALKLMGRSYSLIPFYEGTARDHANADVIQNAQTIIANSHPEKDAIKKDYPEVDVKVVHWAAGQHFDKQEPFQCEHDPYVLQVGRIEERKNQLTTIKVTQDFEHPLVLICPHLFAPHHPYIRRCLDAAMEPRSAPVIIYSLDLPNIVKPNLQIHKLDAPLSTGALHSAYLRAGINLHPAFCELPGLTTLESAKLGRATIASTSSTLANYLPNFEQVKYSHPTDYKNIKHLLGSEFGKSYPQYAHPILERTPLQVGIDLINNIY